MLSQPLEMLLGFVTGAVAATVKSCRGEYAEADPPADLCGRMWHCLSPRLASETGNAASSLGLSMVTSQGFSLRLLAQRVGCMLTAGGLA